MARGLGPSSSFTLYPEQGAPGRPDGSYTVATGCAIISGSFPRHFSATPSGNVKRHGVAAPDTHLILDGMGTRQNAIGQVVLMCTDGLSEGQ